MQAECVHRFRIEELNGDRIRPGKCSKCGETREFKVRPDDWLRWGDMPGAAGFRNREPNLYPFNPKMREGWR